MDTWLEAQRRWDPEDGELVRGWGTGERLGVIRGSLSKEGPDGGEGLLWDLEGWDLGHAVRQMINRG